MRVVIVYPPNQLMPIETPRPDGSLGPLYLAGALREIGIEPDLVDMSVGTKDDTLEDTFYKGVLQKNGLTRIGMSKERIAGFFADGQYDIVAIHSNFTPQTNMAFEVAEIADKVLPRAKIIAGGVNARAMAGRFYATGLFDWICPSEGEKAIQYFVRNFPQSNDTFPYENLDDLPFPAWDKLPFEKYEAIASPHGVDLLSKERYAPIMTSRGCPFRCSFCHISTEKGGIGDLRLKSEKRVLQEIEILQGLGVKKLFIEDDSFLAKKRRVAGIFNAIRKMGFTIADVNGVNLVHLFNGNLKPDKDYMEMLFDAGFKQIVFPVESGSQRVLNKYASAKLKLALMNVVELARVAVNIGILCPVNMMIGFPDETEKEILQSVELAQKLIDVGVPYITFFIPIPFPGSKLYDIVIREGYLDPQFDPDTMNWKNGVMEYTTVPKERIIELRDWAWERVNHSDYIARRIQESIGARWRR